MFISEDVVPITKLQFNLVAESFLYFTPEISERQDLSLSKEYKSILITLSFQRIFGGLIF
jgi:hypothetical protein